MQQKSHFKPKKTTEVNDICTSYQYLNQNKYKRAYFTNDVFMLLYQQHVMHTYSVGKMLRILNALSFLLSPKYNEVGKRTIILLFTEKEIRSFNSLIPYTVSPRDASFNTNFYYRPSDSKAVILDDLLVLLLYQFAEQYVMNIFISLLQTFLCKIIGIIAWHSII